jgi:bacterioferritin (cytochrome b1)
MEKMAAKNSARVIDLLTERLVFERAGVRLYDQVIARMRESSDENITRMLETMQEHRGEEKEHEEWLEECIRKLGGDPDAETEHSRLVREESKGIEEVVENDTSLPHLFHALLMAELADNAGWDLLHGIASELGDSAAKKEFAKRLREEADHLLFVRKAVQKFALSETTGEPQKMPKGSGTVETLLK